MQFIPYFFVLLAMVLLVWQLYPLIKIKSAQGKLAPSLSTLLSKEQREHSTILLYFMSPQCGLCQNITPIVDKLSMIRSDIIRIDLTENMIIAKDLGVRATPAFVLIHEGVVEKVKLGALAENKILEMINK
ncbi:MAG: thioredoxin family protein [Cocleimonas sp.]